MLSQLQNIVRHKKRKLAKKTCPVETTNTGLYKEYTGKVALICAFLHTGRDVTVPASDVVSVVIHIAGMDAMEWIKKYFHASCERDDSGHTFLVW